VNILKYQKLEKEKIRTLNLIKNKKILILKGKKSFNKKNTRKIFKSLFLNNRIVFLTKIHSYPQYSELKKIIYFIKKEAPDIMIAIGGGCVLDYAKIANIKWKNNDLLKNIKKNKVKNIYGRYCKLYAIPTTAGSGAETTSNAVLYYKKIKYSLENKFIKPNQFILIPELIKNCPFKVRCSAVLDCVAQAIESVLSKNSNKISREYSQLSLKLSRKNIFNYIVKPNISNSFKMLIASNYSGKAINISKTTAAHACSYFFTGFYNIMHGHAVHLTFNSFLRFNYCQLCKNKKVFFLYKQIFKATKTKNIEELVLYLSKIQRKTKFQFEIKKLIPNIKKNKNKFFMSINKKRLRNSLIKYDKTQLDKIIFEN
jgi:alcohol dehydrogenase class IV